MCPGACMTPHRRVHDLLREIAMGHIHDIHAGLHLACEPAKPARVCEYHACGQLPTVCSLGHWRHIAPTTRHMQIDLR